MSLEAMKRYRVAAITSRCRLHSSTLQLFNASTS